MPEQDKGIGTLCVEAPDSPPASPPALRYESPRILEVGSTVTMIRGGGGGSGQDCRYYYYYESGPYGC
ncbi:MAG: hypothetical protein AB7O88_15505 [Reyranellaceae bacterium]